MPRPSIYHSDWDDVSDPQRSPIHLTHRATGWEITSVGGGVHADSILLWTPKIFGPDETCTCKYAKSWPIGAERCTVFDGIYAAIFAFDDNKCAEIYPPVSGT